MNTTASPPAASLPTDRDSVIVYFDGVCGFCNAAVQFLLDRDPKGKLHFTPLQGETACQNLDEADVVDLNTFVISKNGQNYRRSAAAVRVLWTLGGVYSVAGTLLWLIPRPLRDLGYRLVAKYRYRFFGKQEACRLPKPEERDRFLP